MYLFFPVLVATSPTTGRRHHRGHLCVVIAQLSRSPVDNCSKALVWEWWFKEPISDQCQESSHSSSLAHSVCLLRNESHRSSESYRRLERTVSVASSIEWWGNWGLRDQLTSLKRPLLREELALKFEFLLSSPFLLCPPFPPSPP